MRLKKIGSSLDSSMDLFASSTEDVASNTDADADVTAFDTDLPAAHNVNIFFFICFYRIDHRKSNK